MNILNYCIENTEKITNFNQKGFLWRKRFNRTPFNTIEDFNRLLIDKTIPNELNREHIVDAFNSGEFYKGYILAMLWGGISTLPRKDTDEIIKKELSSAFRAFNVNKEEVESTLNLVKQHISEGKYQNAYVLLSETNKIPGVDVSFFTKLLFFISESLNKNKLLIYDKWTKVIHLKLLLESNEKEKIEKYFGNNYFYKFFKIETSKITTNLIYVKNEFAFEAYMDYCDKMKQLSTEISNLLETQLNSGQIEAFIFGNPLKGKKNQTNDNPRHWIRNSVINKCK